MQFVNLNDDEAPCSKCGTNLATLGTFRLVEEKESTSREKKELCKCTNCGKDFILHYDLFDKDNHINNFVFGGDVNDPAYNWQDQLTKSQKIEIGEHLKTCTICNGRLINEITSDAWLASLIHGSSRS